MLTFIFLTEHEQQPIYQLLSDLQRVNRSDFRQETGRNNLLLGDFVKVTHYTLSVIDKITESLSQETARGFIENIKLS